MIEILETDFLTKPYPYQLNGIKHIFNIYNEPKRPYGSEFNAAIFDEMGVGKSKQAIDGASIAYENDLIDMVIVVCPASVRGVWDNPETGEIRKHCKSDYICFRYDANFKNTAVPKSDNQLIWITISYSFLRSRISDFLKLVKNSKLRFMLILDESSYVKSHSTQQTKACKILRQLAYMCVLLNGTPIANKILDLWSQFDILDPTAIGNIGYYHFRARYCIMGGYNGKEAFDFDSKVLDKLYSERDSIHNELLSDPSNYNLSVSLQIREEKIQRLEQVRDALERLKIQLKPWIIRREKKDVLADLPEKLPPVYLEAPLSTEGYAVYKQMRDEMVAWANTAEYSQAANGAVKLGRLSQITSGFLGGIVSSLVLDDFTDGTTKSFIVDQEGTPLDTIGAPREVDRAKLLTFLEWKELNRDLKVVVWCRFRAEMFRLKKELDAIGYKTGLIIGGQKSSEREEILSKAYNGELDVVIANPSSGGFGLDGLQNHFYTSVHMSMDHSLIKYLQSSDRLHRHGQTMPISYIFILATSPNGGKTVDHLVLNAVMNKEEMATWGMNRWQEAVRNL